MRRLWLATVALIGLSGGWAFGNYTATQGVGTDFGSVVVSGVHYAQQFLCDLTVPARCATVSAGGAVSTSSAQSGTWNVTNVSGTVSLPTGAATAAKQPALGTAGSASTDVLTVQGIASMTPLLATVTATNLSTNIAQINGVTPLMGNGATGTGSIRATIANDNTVPTGWPTAANQATANTSLASIDTKVGSAVPAGTAHIGTVGVAPYPDGATPYTATATGTTGATTATLAGASSVTTYICGFSIRANATAAATGNATVTGVITATMNFTQWTAPNASGLGITEMIFAPCIPASATNTSIAVVSAAPGTGGVVSVTTWGYKQ